MSEDDMIDEMIQALRFYKDGFRPTVDKKVRGITYKPTDELLDDCGNVAAQVLGKYGRVIKS